MSQPNPLVFEEGTHKYYLNGQLRPGVTSVLDAAGYIPFFAKKSGEATERGTAVHRITELIDKGIPPDEYPEKYHPYVAAWEDFTARMGYEFEAIEEQCYDQENELFCGTIDRRGIKLNGKRFIGDMYTGVKFPTYKRLQTKAYKIMKVQTNPEYADAERLVWIINPWKPVVEVVCPEEFEDGLAWTGCLNNFWFKQKFCPSLLPKG